MRTLTTWQPRWPSLLCDVARLPVLVRLFSLLFQLLSRSSCGTFLCTPGDYDSGDWGVQRSGSRDTSAPRGRLFLGPRTKGPSLGSRANARRQTQPLQQLVLRRQRNPPQAGGRWTNRGTFAHRHAAATYYELLWIIKGLTRFLLFDADSFEDPTSPPASHLRQLTREPGDPLLWHWLDPSSHDHP